MGLDRVSEFIFNFYRKEREMARGLMPLADFYVVIDERYYSTSLK